MDKLVLLTNLMLTGYLTGLIWTIQLVHYPLFAAVGTEAWPRYHALHNTWITLAVGPAMVAELVLAAALVLVRPPGLPLWLTGLAAALALSTWGFTVLVSVPIHAQLSVFDPVAIQRLVDTNWLRTIAWSVRLFVLAYGGWVLLTVRPT